MGLLRVDAAAFLWGALLLLLLPLKWLAAAAAAALVHEICHIGAVCLSGGRILQIRIGAAGMQIETTPLSPGQELLCALAGPLGSLSMLLLLHSLPRLAICGAVQGMYNLLPLFPLDGGRALRCGLELLTPKYAPKISEWIESGVLAVLAILAVAGFIAWNLGILPAIAVGIPVIRRIRRKIPCKAGRFAVQ